MGSESYGQIVQQIYQPLFDWAVDFELTPILATSWDKIDDLHYVFHLRDDVKFSDGSDFKASDVLFSMVAASEDPAQSQTVNGVDFENTKVVDDYTIEIAFTSPYIVNFINISSVRIASEAAFNNSADGLITETCGTGPYTLGEYSPGSSIQLVYNENYWGPKPQITEIEFKVIPEASQRTNALLAGDVDLITTVGYSDLIYFDSLEDYETQGVIAHRSSSLFFNTTENSVLENVELRRAIAYAVNKEGILNTVYSGYGKVAEGPFTTMFKDFKEEYIADGYYDFNMDKAKEAFAASGAAEGTPITLICNGAANDAATAQIIQATLNEVGFAAEIVTYDAAVYFGTLTDMTSGWDIAIQYTTCPSGLSADLVNAWILHLGITGYKDPDFVAAVEEALQQSDIEAMVPATKTIYDKVMNDVPYLAYTQMATYFAYNSKIKDVVLWNQGGLRFELYKVEE